MPDNHARISPALVETVAGLSAGAISTLVVHPLDVIKTRLQIHRNTSVLSFNGPSILYSLYRQPRPLQSFYRGLSPNLLGNASSWAIFFYFKSIAEQQLLSFHNGQSANSHGTSPNPPGTSLSPADFFLASLFSGLSTTLATNPIWVLKTRMLSSDKNTQGAYPNMLAGARHIWRNDGVRGFYRGLGISLLGNSHGAVQFAVYEPLKQSWKRYSSRGYRSKYGSRQGEEKEGAKISNAATLALSGAAKIVAGTVTYPYQVLRSRMQTYDAEEKFGKGIRGAASKLWREDGWKGFYRGLGANIVRVLPATWVTFLVYENVRYYMPMYNELNNKIRQ